MTFPFCILERYYDASREAQRELDRKKKQLLEIEAEEGKGNRHTKYISVYYIYIAHCKQELSY